MKLPRIVIVAGGTPPDIFTHEIARAPYIIGVDRGAYWLAKQHIRTDVAIGDFDSVTDAERSVVEKHAIRMVVHPAKKDATDLELAVEEAIRQKPIAVDCYGVLGSRFDHSLTALDMVRKMVSHNISGQIVDNFNKITIVRRKLTLAPNPQYRYVSVIPYDSVVTVSLQGFVYDASRLRIRNDSSLGISNEILHTTATIIVHTGTAVVVRSRD